MISKQLNRDVGLLTIVIEEPRTKSGLSHKILKIELVPVSATGLQFLPSVQEK